MTRTEVKYRHPQNHDLTWTGRGRQPKWVEAALSNGMSLVSLEVAQQERDDQITGNNDGEGEINLGIGEAISQPTLGERLYAGRIASGVAELPGNDSPSFTTGVRQALATVATTERTEVETQGQSGVAEYDAAPSEASQQQLEVCLREFGFQAMTAQEFIQSGVDYINQATVYACRAGVAFWAAQEALKSESESSALGRTSEFKDWIAEAGLTKERVYECIRIAKFYARLPGESRAKALAIGKKHALLLAALPQEVIDHAAESGNDLIGRADMMTVAELKEEIKALQRREKNYEAQLERATHQVQNLMKAKTRTTEFLLRTEEIREECMSLQLGGELHLNSLRKLFDEVDTQAPEGMLQAEHVWIAANALAARALDLLDYLQARAPEGMPDRPQARHLLTPEEAQRWLLDYPLIENRHAAEAAVRESRREASRPRGPGRPKGSSNKSAGA
ncbi:H-NS family nucleoid-associated regulatory protein [Rhodocyclus gracilis]|uniref:H-NS histone family protein n=1 Tax=Rhodocyclus gracilis TaxID=2929842 RepID=UPI001ADA0656|nr:H-NS family nucleoid-associated regulatory protein [Rhodocyclus gracilis]